MLCFAVTTLFVWKIQFLYPNTSGSTVSGAIDLPLEVQDCKSFQLLDVSQIRVGEKGGSGTKSESGEG
jgi:hypothetical protein